MRVYPMTLLAALPMMLSPVGWGADATTGQEAYNSGDYETALAEWQPLAEEGITDAQFGMGLLYANGFGVPLNDDQALKWYLLAADRGHAGAQCNLAVMHQNGWGVPQSDAEAFKWYSLAAEQGFAQALLSVGKIYLSGFGAEKDNVQAHMWYSIAFRLGDYNAEFKLDDVAMKMSVEEIAEADRLTDAWMESHQELQANH